MRGVRDRDESDWSETMTSPPPATAARRRTIIIHAPLITVGFFFALWQPSQSALNVGVLLVTGGVFLALAELGALGEGGTTMTQGKRTS